MSGPTFPDFLETVRERHVFDLKGDAARLELEARLRPQPDLVPECEVLSEVEGDGLVFQRLAIQFPVTGQAEAFFLRPYGKGPFPALVLLHDHGSRFDIGKEKTIFPHDQPHSAPRDWVERFYGGAFIGDRLARLGYAVLSIDALGWGGRSVGAYENQQALAANIMQFGLSWAGIIAAEDNWTTNLLATLPRVDGNRIGAVGLSMGAFRTWQLAALSPRIKAFAAICWMARMQALMVEGNNQLRGQSAFSMLHPALAGRIDYPQIAALAAPKPAVFIAGREDGLFPPTSVAAAFDDLTQAWAEQGSAHLLTTRLRSGGHAFTREDQDLAFAVLGDALVPKL